MPKTKRVRCARKTPARQTLCSRKTFAHTNVPLELDVARRVAEKARDEFEFERAEAEAEAESETPVPRCDIANTVIADTRLQRS